MALAVWKGKVQSAQQQQELEEIKRVRDELLDAKQEVGVLLEQLEVVSEKVVEELSAKVDEMRQYELKTTDIDRPGTDPETDMIGQAHSETTDDLPEIDETAASLEEGPDAEDADNSQGGIEVDSFSSFKPRNVSRNSTGKTIMFPGRKDSGSRSESVASGKEPEQGLSPKHQMVYAMDKLGYSEEEIAKQMKIGKGEVKLLLQLKRKGEEVNA